MAPTFEKELPEPILSDELLTQTQGLPMPRVAALVVWFIARAESVCNRCTDHTPVTQGSFSDHTFVPDSGCYHGVPDVGDTFALLSGSWVVTVGGSNSWATYTALANQLQPGYYNFHPERGGAEKTRFSELVPPRSNHCPPAPMENPDDSRVPARRRSGSAN